MNRTIVLTDNPSPIRQMGGGSVVVKPLSHRFWPMIIAVTYGNLWLPSIQTVARRPLVVDTRITELIQPANKLLLIKGLLCPPAWR